MNKLFIRGVTIEKCINLTNNRSYLSNDKTTPRSLNRPNLLILLTFGSLCQCKTWHGQDSFEHNKYTIIDINCVNI